MRRAEISCFPLSKLSQNLRSYASTHPPFLACIQVQPLSSSGDDLMNTKMRKSDSTTRSITPRRSVPGMKGLLPLQLSPPPLPDGEFWPSSKSLKRYTFGFQEIPTNPGGLSERRRAKTPSSKHTRLPLLVKTRQYRDTPIYIESGSPPIEQLNFQQSPRSSCDYSIDGCSSFNTETEEQYESMSDIESDNRNARWDQTGSWASNPTDLSRDSDLSFQCMGEQLFPDEAAWLRSPTRRNGNFSRPLPEVLAQSMPEMKRIESWCSEASVSDDEPDIFAQEITLAPSRAHVVDVGLKSPSGLSIYIPPRSSSLPGTHLMPLTPANSTYSWMDLDDSPPIPEPCERFYKPRGSDFAFANGSQPALPARRLDMEIPSPPLSPELHENQLPGSTNLSPGLFQFSMDSPSLEIDQTTPSPNHDPVLDILTVLENATSHSPTIILTHDAPCTLGIRAMLNQSKTRPSSNNASRLLPPFSYDTKMCVQTGAQPLRPVTFYSPSRNRHETSSSGRHAQKWSSGLETPALEALRRTFPDNEHEISALYAHILAYIFTCGIETDFNAVAATIPHDLPFRNAQPPRNNMLGILGVECANAHSSDDPSDAVDFSDRTGRLSKTLESCIYQLLYVMRNASIVSSSTHADAAFLRCLVEVVKASEGIVD